jgi:cell wall-associated NlpC family hydrolase
MTGPKRRSAARLLVAVLILVSSVVSASLSSAAPTRQEVEEAKARLDALNRELSLLVEEYNQAQIRLQEVQARLVEVQGAADRAQAKADRATESLNRSAARAYTGLGSQFAVLFDATSLGDFSDRLEFIGRMAQADVDLATAAEVARQEAEWTADELKATVEERRLVLAELDGKRDQIEARVDEARGLYEELDREFQEAVAAAAAAQAAAAQASTTSVGPSIPAPPAPNPQVQAVLDAAYSAIGTPYQWGGSSPETGFDCSGFTMWSWSHAGVSLPHSSAAQYAALPKVGREDLQPGDLLFFYTPISHVAMYVGGGRMIHASHPGVPVGVVAVYWQYFVGAARPG